MQTKVLFVAASIPPKPCGIGYYTFRLIEELSKNKDLSLSCFTNLSIKSGIERRRLKSCRFFNGFNNIAIIDLYKFIITIKKFNPDIIHIQYPSLGYSRIASALMPLISKLFKAKLVETWHEHYVDCKQITPFNLFGLSALVHIRPDSYIKLPFLIKFLLKNKISIEIPNSSTIPLKFLSDKESKLFVKKNLKHVKNKKIITFFGFLNKNKNVEILFDMLDPSKNFILLVTDPNDFSTDKEYKKLILDKINSKKWKKSCSYTGFLKEDVIANYLAISDAIIFPFKEASSRWNTSIKAAINSGSLVIFQPSQVNTRGYNKINNTYLLDNFSQIPFAIEKFSHNKNLNIKNDDWPNIARRHIQLYKLVKNKIRH